MFTARIDGGGINSYKQIKSSASAAETSANQSNFIENQFAGNTKAHRLGKYIFRCWQLQCHRMLPCILAQIVDYLNEFARQT